MQAKVRNRHKKPDSPLNDRRGGLAVFLGNQMRRVRFLDLAGANLSPRLPWVEKAKFWPRAYQTRIFDQRREVVGRGPTPQASHEEAEQSWVAGLTTETK